MPLTPTNEARQQRLERGPAALPQTAQAALFRVRGGAVRLDALIARFTAAADATLTNLTVVANPSVGADVALSAATAIASLAAGHHLALGATVGAAMASSASGAVALPGNGLMVVDGTVDALTSASNAAARVEWILLWTPLDANARVTIA